MIQSRLIAMIDICISKRNTCPDKTLRRLFFNVYPRKTLRLDIYCLKHKIFVVLFMRQIKTELNLETSHILMFSGLSFHHETVTTLGETS